MKTLCGTAVNALFLAALIPLFLVWQASCEAPVPDALDATLADINPILNNEDLTPQQKRDRLEALGLAPLIINALLYNERTGNQFGGDLRSAYDKVVAGRLNELTPDEVQLYGDAAEEVSTEPAEFTFSDEEAQLIVDLFQAFDIATVDDLVAVLDDPAAVAGLPADLPLDAVEQLFVDFDSDLLIDQLP